MKYSFNDRRTNKVKAGFLDPILNPVTINIRLDDHIPFNADDVAEQHVFTLKQSSQIRGFAEYIKYKHQGIAMTYPVTDSIVDLLPKGLRGIAELAFLHGTLDPSFRLQWCLYSLNITRQSISSRRYSIGNYGVMFGLSVEQDMALADVECRMREIFDRVLSRYNDIMNADPKWEIKEDKRRQLMFIHGLFTFKIIRTRGM